MVSRFNKNLNGTVKMRCEMSKGSKQHFKQFTIDNIYDACVALASLISGVTINLEKYQEYSDEAVALINSADKPFVSAKEYDNINDKLLYRQHEMLKLIADHQSSSFSYIDLRAVLVKKKLLSTDLDEELKQLLNELLDVRNWTFHNPQSLMVAAKEVVEKNIPEELREIVQCTPQINPVLIRKVVSYELVFLGSLVTHTERRIKQFQSILARMKDDYQEMFDSVEPKSFTLLPGTDLTKVQYIERPVVSRLDDLSSDTSQISMAIQKSKYDGSEDSFKDWVVRLQTDKPE